MKQRGNGLFKQGKLEEAAQCYEEAIQLGAGDTTLVASCHQNLAAVHDELVSPCNPLIIWKTYSVSRNRLKGLWILKRRYVALYCRVVFYYWAPVVISADCFIRMCTVSWL